MWLVQHALRRPYTVAVMAILILLGGVLSSRRMPVDIFPAVDIPVVAVIWNYPGLSAEDMERRVVLISERSFSTTVNGIERIESQSIFGIGLLKIYFQPGMEIGAAVAQISAVASAVLRLLPPGMQPPSVIQFNASNVPVAQVTLSSETLPEERIFDYALNFIRVRLFAIRGLSTPAPFGGRTRQVNIDLDRRALAARGLSAADVVSALGASNVIIPAGTARMADRDYAITMNSSPAVVEQFAAIPVRMAGTVPVLLGDVARVSDGYADQTNIVRVDGRRSTYLAIIKRGDASTLAVVDAAREALPAIRAVAPQGLELKIDFDQSVFVRAAIRSVITEAVLASLLVSLLIGLFLGSWRSAVIVCTSIPLAVFSALSGLALTGQTLNLMTLGGLALSIGMLVDDAAVEVENIHRNRRLGKPLPVAILDGARQIAVPAVVSTLAICIVFLPVLLLTGPARYLFVPLALAVVLAMLASYLLSRTLVPVLARLLMSSEPGWHAGGKRLQAAFGRALQRVLAMPRFTLALGLILAVLSLGLLPLAGTDFFPSVDAGLMKLHLRAPPGTRIERTEQLVDAVETRIRQLIPPGELDSINDMIGVPVFYNLAFVQTDNVGPMDAEIRIGLRRGHRPTRFHREQIRRLLAEEFPGAVAYFQPADLISQVLSFGLSAPIDVQVEHPNLDQAQAVALRLRDQMRAIPGTTDVQVSQSLDYPTLRLEVDRQRAAQLGLSQREIASSVLVSLSSSGLLAPSYFLNPENNVNYSVVVKSPLEQVDSVGALMALPLGTAEGGPSPTLASVAEVAPRSSFSQVSHHTVQRVIDVIAGVEGRDLGAVASDVAGRIAALGPLPPGMRISIRGQVEVMRAAIADLGLGLALAVVLVYCLLVVLFQSWLDPLIILLAVPGALAGILWMLVLTRTSLNAASLMGAIMAVGIAVSNSVLLVRFANDLCRERAWPAGRAALEAGKTRLRPVLMTAVAMVAGMVPMAFGLGEAGEQNAPLARAVIGGLLLATVVTLFVVPAAYAVLRGQQRPQPARPQLSEADTWVAAFKVGAA